MIQATHRTYKKHDIMVYRDMTTPAGWLSWEVTDRKQVLNGMSREKYPTRIIKTLKYRIDHNDVFPAEKVAT